jgi:hypothetical protein
MDYAWFVFASRAAAKQSDGVAVVARNAVTKQSRGARSVQSVRHPGFEHSRAGLIVTARWAVPRQDRSRLMREKHLSGSLKVLLPPRQSREISHLV